MFSKKSIVMFSISLPVTLLSLSFSNPSFVLNNSNQMPTSKATSLSQDLNVKLYAQSSKTKNNATVSDANKAIFEANFRIYVSAISMHLADNNGKAPLRIEDVSRYIAGGAIKTPVGAKYFIVENSETKLTLTATYGDMILNSEFENYTTEFSKDKFESNFNVGIVAVNSFIVNNNGKLPSKTSDLKKYFEKDITGDPKGAKYTISKHSQRKIVFIGQYQGQKLEKVFEDKDIDEAFINRLNECHINLVEGIKTYIIQKDGNLPTKLNDLNNYINTKDFLNQRLTKYIITKNNDGSIVLTSTYKDTKLEEFFYPAGVRGEIDIFEQNHRIGISASCMYVADHDGYMPTSIEDIHEYLPIGFNESLEGVTHSIYLNNSGYTVFKSTYKDLVKEYVIN